MERLIVVVSFLLGTFFAMAQDNVLQQLEDSPRHQEWVIISNGNKEIHSFIVYPEVETKAMAIIVLHENRGLTDWVRSMADQIAAEGYIAIAPDMLSDFSENFKKTSDFPVSDDARTAIYQLDPEQVMSDLEAVQTYGQEIPASNGKTAIMGFCWGGSTTFQFATKAYELEAALVFYGSGPKEQVEINDIDTPVYGFYGSKDSRVNATIDETAKMMEVAKKLYNYEIYEDAGHAYMRAADMADADETTIAAKKASMERIRYIFGLSSDE